MEIRWTENFRNNLIQKSELQIGESIKGYYCTKCGLSSISNGKCKTQILKKDVSNEIKDLIENDCIEDPSQYYEDCGCTSFESGLSERQKIDYNNEWFKLWEEFNLPNTKARGYKDMINYQYGRP